MDQGPNKYDALKESSKSLNDFVSQLDGDPSENIDEYLQNHFPSSSDIDEQIRFGQESVNSLKVFYLDEVLSCQKTDIHHKLRLKLYFLSLLGLEELERKKLLKHMLGERASEYKKVINEDVIPAIDAFFRKVLDEHHEKVKTERDDEDIDLDEAITDFVDRGFFPQYVKKLQIQEGLEDLDESPFAKIFYKLFKSHFDACHGVGLMELIHVGEKHPDELKSMQMMQEYDDIRAALLKLQLSGKISSLNYR